MANQHPKCEDDVLRFSGNINDKFVEWVTDVKLWEAEHDGGDETSPWATPLQKRRSWKTMPGQGNTTETLRNDVYRGTQEKKGKEGLESYFDLRQGKAEGHPRQHQP